MEGQNDEHLDGLLSKVKILKDVREFCLVLGLYGTDDVLLVNEDYGWDWPGSARFDGTAKPNG